MGRRGKKSRGSRREGGSKKSDVGTRNWEENSEAGMKEEKLMSIYSRLGLPLLEPNDRNDSLSVNEGEEGEEEEEEEEEEERLEFETHPRFVYSPGMCLVCSSVSRVTCNGCKMISYCTIEHLNENRGSHESLCNALSQQLGGIEGYRLAADPSGDLYRSLRIKMINLVEKKLARPMSLWEREIILYPGICRVCRRIGKGDLIRCPRCMIAFYCNDHCQDHAIWCKDYQVFRRITWMQQSHGKPRINLSDVTSERTSRYIGGPVNSYNFNTLLLDIFSNDDKNIPPYFIDYSLIDAQTYASMSLEATAPLTALFALEKSYREDYLSSRESLVLDIVGAEFEFECRSLGAWEKLFLHRLPNLRVLHLRFTGPELRIPAGAPIDLLSRVALCGRCRNDKRRIIVTLNAGKLYHDLTIPSDETPDLVCLFNPGLYRDTGYDGTDTWPPTIDKFSKPKVPVLVTSYTELEIPRDVQRISSRTRLEIILEPRINPFASVKPDRNFVSDDILPFVYKNYCLSIVKPL